MDLCVCPECGKTVPHDQLVLRPMVQPAMVRTSPNDPVVVETLTPRVCQECHDRMDTMSERRDRMRSRDAQ